MQVEKNRDHDWWVRLYRLMFGLLVIAAAAYQLDRTGNAANFFSFFTIQSNLIAAAVLLFGAVAMPPASRSWDLIRGAAAIYMTLTGIVYNTLLVGLDEQLQTSEPWVNNVLHRVIPIVMLIDFLLVPLGHRVKWREALVWTIYPLALPCVLVDSRLDRRLVSVPVPRSSARRRGPPWTGPRPVEPRTAVPTSGTPTDPQSAGP